MRPEQLCPTFARNLRAARIRAGLSQQALAQKLGGASPQISGWETGRHSPTLETIARISKALDIPPELLLSETGAEMLSAVPA